MELCPQCKKVEYSPNPMYMFICSCGFKGTKSDLITLDKIFISGNCPSSKNSRIWTGRYSVHSKATAKYKKQSKTQWIDNKDKFLTLINGLSMPYRVKFTFIRGSKHKFDYINPAQSCQDLMVEHGYIPDDNADVIIPSFGEYIYDQKNPGVIIEVLNENYK